MTGILGIKKSAPSKKHKQTVSSDASQTKQTPSKSSICALYLAILIQKIGLLSVRYRTNRQVTPKISEVLPGIESTGPPLNRRFWGNVESFLVVRLVESAGFDSFRFSQYLVQARSKPVRKSLILWVIKSTLWVARKAFQPAANASC